MTRPVRVRLSHVVLALCAAAVGAGAAGVVVLYTGFYDIAATHQHLAPTYRLLEIALGEAIERRGRAIEAPRLDDPRLAARGFELYRAHCAQCHGAPGVAPAPFALGLTPLPKNLAHVARERSAGELYWVTKYGIKMSGMPAWAFRFDERDLWAVVAALQELPRLAPQDYAKRIASVDANPVSAERAARGADAARGKVALLQYACTTCHAIPGIVGSGAPVGPPLERIATREYIAGVLPNSRANMIRWIREPQEINPRSAMPNLGVTEQDALDIAQYLYTLR